MSAPLPSPVQVQPRTTLPLPPEVRNHVYEDVFGNPPQRLIKISPKAQRYQPGIPLQSPVGGPDTTQLLPLLLTSRQTSIEACAIWYRFNHYFPRLKLLARFLQRIGHAHRCQLASLTFGFGIKDTMPDGLALLKHCPNLKSLEVRLEESSTYAMPNLAILLEELRGLEIVRFNMEIEAERASIIYWDDQVKLLKYDELERLMKRPRVEAFDAKPGDTVYPSQMPEPIIRKRVIGRPRNKRNKGRQIQPWQKRPGWRAVYRERGKAELIRDR